MAIPITNGCRSNLKVRKGGLPPLLSDTLNQQPNADRRSRFDYPSLFRRG